MLKPRGQWHTLWNAGDTPCLIIEVISPAGFENYFREDYKGFVRSTYDVLANGKRRPYT